MDYLSEVLKIIEGATKANASMASNYAGLLADKLEQAGEVKQAKMVRERLLRAPQALAGAQKAGGGVSIKSLPVDIDSRLNTVDVSYPKLDKNELFLPAGIKSRVDEFITNVQRFDEFFKLDAALPSRLLIYGKPGTGKTMMSKYIASRLSYPLLTVRCDTLISSLLGQTSKNLRQVFEYVTQQPCVLFLDEFDALAGARGNERDIGELQRVVISLLQNIDAASDDTIIIASTNHEQLLDPAVWRRFSFRIPMPLPDQCQRELIWKNRLKNMIGDDLDLTDLAKKSEGMSGAIIEQVSLDARRDAVIEGNKKISIPKLYRRLYLAQSLIDGVNLSTYEDEIRWLRSKDQKAFSIRILASLYKLTSRVITNILKEPSAYEQKGHTV
ncbi:anti-phage ATPase IteA [Kosakonia sp. BK9b]|uniref:anti-phage ATPase IteA n=1 Tax=Phytobacter diazotrophicus TaxID=395631 RepID=UPI001C9A084D|nr:anti-phage ATPase IteA [Phytobacter diazotrophicus]MBY6255160.1 ATP-binding protein [Phytobacter diazotrophicus]